MPNVRVHHMAFDAVKRKEVLGMVGHGGYYSCCYCDIKGVHTGGIGGKVVFPYRDAINANLRTDKEIREVMSKIDDIEDPDVRKGIVDKSPLLDLKHFSFIDQIGLDYLHNYCLGKSLSGSIICL